MPKNFRTLLRQIYQRIRLRRQGVIVNNNTVVNNVVFKGKAVIEPYNRLIGIDQITIGDNFYLNAGCHLLGEINIGNDVMIGPKTVIWGRDHGISKGQLMRLQEHTVKSISIGNNVWIGANVTILKGVTISDGAVIGAGSVVTKDIPSNVVAFGNPCRVIKDRL